MVEEEQTQVDAYELSDTQLNIGLLLPRVTGTITFISSVCMLLMAWKRRNLLFHRLVLGMSLNQLVSSLFQIYGTAALPSDDINTSGNFGTVATCTTQGFFIYIGNVMSMFYYASFSVYSFVGILSNFEKEKYVWVEKYIHAIVPMYPLITAFIILSKQGFNPSSFGYCAVTNTPRGCDDPNYDNILCERGHLNHAVYFYIVYYIIAFFFPTAVMVFLYVKVTQKQSQIFIDAKKVAHQAAIYLFVLYLVILPWFVITGVHAASGNRENIPFEAYVFVKSNFDLFGLYIILIYTYFTFDRLGSNSNSKRNGNSNDNDNDNGNDNGNATDNVNGKENENDTTTKKDSIAATTTNNNSSEMNANNNEFIFGSEAVTVNSSTVPMTVTAPAPTRVPVTEEQKYSFNIFDGTNAGSSEFAAFVHDGDSDDERVDHEQTAHWEAIQDHV